MCGTVQANRRGLPKVNGSLQCGDADFMKKGDLTFVHWMDKRDVRCLSTFHGNQMVPYTTRRRDAEDVNQP